MTPPMTRRDFIRGTAFAVLGTAVGFSQEARSPAASKSRVILIRHPEALDENSQFNEPVIQQMLDEAVMKLLDQTDPAAAFRLAGQARGHRRHQKQRLVLSADAPPGGNGHQAPPAGRRGQRGEYRHRRPQRQDEPDLREIHGPDQHPPAQDPLPGRNVRLHQELHHVRGVPGRTIIPTAAPAWALCSTCPRSRERPG